MSLRIASCTRRKICHLFPKTRKISSTSILQNDSISGGAGSEKPEDPSQTTAAWHQPPEPPIPLSEMTSAQLRAWRRLLSNPKKTSSLAYRPKNTVPLPTRPEDMLNLPPMGEWRGLFGATLKGDRVSVANPDTAARLANAFVPKGSRDKVIIESYPGPGALTRALMDLPRERIKKIIVLEEYGPYLEWLKPLATVDDRIVVLPYPGWSWDTYVSLTAEGYLDGIDELPWTGGVHPTLQFISHLPPTILGEQLVAQLFRSIPEVQWLFRYGRVPLHFILSDHVWQRINAGPTHSLRGKLAIIAEASSKCKLALPLDALADYNAHFYPPKPAIVSQAQGQKAESRRLGGTWHAANITPIENQVIGHKELDMWDFCLRRLFVLKASPLKSAISSMAPGAAILLKKVNGPDTPEQFRIDPKTQVRRLTLQQWISLIKAFAAWPFRPTELHISDVFTPKGEKDL